MHTHDFWQLEIVVTGILEVKSKKTKLRAEGNDCILIPPGIPHSFIYGDWEQSTWSIKFSIEANYIPEQITLLERSAASMDTRSSILKAFKDFNMTQDLYVILQGLLGTLIELDFQRRSNECNSPFVDQVTRIIDSYGGRPVTIKELALQLKCSRNHISNKFHAEKGITLKAFIDLRRIEIAREMLLYSNHKISTIAEIMGFNNLYSFSRFFSHHHGCSPRQYVKLTRK
jgi:AraC-like DNA-binding protein